MRLLLWSVQSNLWRVVLSLQHFPASSGTAKLQLSFLTQSGGGWTVRGKSWGIWGKGDILHGRSRQVEKWGIFRYGKGECGSKWIFVQKKSKNHYLPSKEASFSQTPLRNIECTATGSHKVLTNVTASQLHQMDKTQFSDFWFGGWLGEWDANNPI